jgi:hypothetical protein
MPKPVAIFHSEKKSLTLSFSPEDDKSYKEKDHDGGDQLLRNFQFVNGVLEVYKEGYAILLRKDKRNQANGGGDFFELRKSEVAEIDALRVQDQSADRKKGELTQAEKDILEKLFEFAKDVTIDQKDDCIAVIKEVLSSFKMKGFKTPKGDEAPRVLMATAIFMKEALTNAGMSPNL